MKTVERKGVGFLVGGQEEAPERDVEGPNESKEGSIHLIGDLEPRQQ